MYFKLFVKILSFLFYVLLSSKSYATTYLGKKYAKKHYIFDLQNSKIIETYPSSKKKIKVGLMLESVITFPTTAGLPYKVYHLSKAMLDRGIQYIFYCCNRDFETLKELNQSYFDPRIKVHIIPESKFYNALYVSKLMHNDGIDILQIETPQTLLNVGLKIKQLLNLPVLTVMHDLENELMGGKKGVCRIRSFIFLFLFLLLTKISKAHYHWVDFPKGDIEKICYDPEPIFKDINGLVSQYHNLKKSKEENLDNRISLLKKINKNLQKLKRKANTDETKEIIMGLITIAEEKHNYLKNLKKLKKIGIKRIKHDVYKLPYTYKDTKYYYPLFLRNVRKYDHKAREFWGEFLLEAIDPCHRKLSHYYAKWRKLNCENANIFHFFLWLEDQDIPTYIPHIKLIPETTLKQYKISVLSGKLYSSPNKPLNTENNGNEPIFIIKLNKDILLCVILQIKLDTLL